MQIYTDCPDQLNGFFPEKTGWRLLNREDLAPEDAVLWQALRDTPTLWGAELPTPSLSRLVIVEKASDSQYDTLRDLLKNGHALPDGTAALALEGDGFHGRFNRPWRALRGNIHLSIYQRITVPVQQAAAGLSMLPAVAALEAIMASCGAACGAGIKWVNDITMQGCKVAGVLTAAQSKGTRLEHVVSGIGINVETAPQVPATPFVPKAGSLRSTGPDDGVTMPAVFWNLLQVWSSRFAELKQQGSAPLLESYRKHSVIIGKPVRIWDEDITDHPEKLQDTPPLAAGTVLSIEADLGLKLRGLPAPVTRGRLAFEEACRAHGL